LPSNASIDLRAAFSGLFEGFALDVKVNLLRARMSLDNLVMLMVLGQMVGLPVVAPFYSLNLLPYFIPQVEKWKRTMLRDRDLTDFV